MTGSLTDFPFTIRDIVGLLNLRVRRRQADSDYIDCPFCGDRRGKMNVNYAKNVWRCNYCGEGGGMLDLYARAYGICKSDAYREICGALQADIPTGEDVPPAHRHRYRTPSHSQSVPATRKSTRHIPNCSRCSA